MSAEPGAPFPSYHNHSDAKERKRERDAKERKRERTFHRVDSWHHTRWLKFQKSGAQPQSGVQSQLTITVVVIGVTVDLVCDFCFAQKAWRLFFGHDELQFAAVCPTVFQFLARLVYYYHMSIVGRSRVSKS